MRNLEDADSVRARIARLAAAIDRDWAARGYDEHIFPEVAHDQLRAFMAEGPPGSRELAHWGFSPEHDSADPVSSVDSPQLKLYTGPRFRIDAFFWFGHLTEIEHQGVTGAVGLAEGEAVRSEWEFIERERLDEGVHRGRLTQIGTSLARAGTVRPLAPSDRCIEQTMFLDATNVTLLVRTHAACPRVTYRRPGLALRRQSLPAFRVTQLALLSEIPRRFATFAVETCALEVIRHGSLLDAFELLSFMAARGFNRTLIEDVCAEASEVHGEHLDLVWRSVELEAEQRALFTLARDVAPHQRLLWFLLLLLPDKTTMLSFLEREIPAAPAETTLWKWLLELRDALGFQADELSTLLLRALFDGLAETQVLDRLREVYEPQDIEAQRGEIDDVCRKIVGHPVLRNLLAGLASTTPADRLRYECRVGEPTLRSMPYPARFARNTAERKLILNPNIVVQEHDTLPPRLEGQVPFADRLGQRRPIVWAQEPTTSHWMPYWLSPDDDATLRAALRGGGVESSDLPAPVRRQLYEAGILIYADDGDGRIQAWTEAIERARASYARDGYAVLPRLINPVQVAALRTHNRALHAAGRFSSERSYLGNLAIHLEPATRFIHHQILRTVRAIVGENIQPSFCYTRIYEPRARLPRHVDRPNCAWNVSIPFDLIPETEARDSWPLYVDCNGIATPIRLEMGDGALYRGIETEHWRDPQPEGHRSILGIFLFAPSTFHGTLY